MNRGYMSPEYAWTGMFSEKSDIYAFGVLQLEIISGKKISSFSCGEEGKTLLEYVRHFLYPPSVPNLQYLWCKQILRSWQFLNYISGMGILARDWWSGSVGSRYFKLVFSSWSRSMCSDWSTLHPTASYWQTKHCTSSVYDHNFNRYSDSKATSLCIADSRSRGCCPSLRVCESYDTNWDIWAIKFSLCINLLHTEMYNLQ